MRSAEHPEGHWAGFRTSHFGGFLLLILLIVGFFAAYSVVFAMWTAQGPQSVIDALPEFLEKHSFSGLSALFAGLAFAGVISTLRMQERQLRKTIDDFEESNRNLHYGELDRLYFDLLKIALDKPHLRRGTRFPETDDRRREQDIYAYMVWNFIETIHDRVNNASDKEGEQLLATWGRTELHEMALHHRWWRTSPVDDMFKPAFVSYVSRRLTEIGTKRNRSRDPQPGTDSMAQRPARADQPPEPLP